MKVIGVLIFLILYVLGAALGQQSISAPSLTTVLPPAPNAYALTQYSGLAVNQSMGSTAVSIPIGSVTAKGMSLPISLNYNSGNGVKVNQIASRAGMNWVLNAGGVISRTVHGLADESNTWLAPLTLECC